MRFSALTLSLSIVTTFAVSACTAPSSEDLDSSQAAERWNDRNNPAFIESSFVYSVDRLPTAGKTNVVPTPSDYWATYRDSINVRWDSGELSPAEKYEKAFGISGLALEVSRRHGIRSQTNRPECSREGDCAGLDDGSSCAIPRGESSGRCIPTWFGICPGWASSAFMEPSPKNSVTKNGVTFYPGDLEALMSLIYDQADMPTKFIGGRCNLDRLPTDSTGRVTSPECRDLNPGALHVILANKVGVRRESLVVERVASLQVWNQPVRGYRVTNANGDQLREVSASDAARLVGTGSAFSPDAKRFFHVELDLDWIAEAHPARTSHVGQAGSFTRTDHVEYILETDSQGHIIGGEYVGESREEHPDFAWWPTSRPSGTIGVGISYEAVKQLNDKAAGGGGDLGGDNGGNNGNNGGNNGGNTGGETVTKTLLDNIRIDRLEYQTATIAVPTGRKLTVTTSGSGEFDLMVDWNREPSFSNNVCTSDRAGTNETCTMTAPAGNPTAFIRVNAFQASRATVKATISD